MKRSIIALALAAGLGLAGCSTQVADKPAGESMEKPAMEQSMEKDASMEKGSAMQDASMDKGSSMEGDGSMGGDSMMQRAGLVSLGDYQAMSAEQLSGKRPYLFFNATWCPTCRAIVNGLAEDASWVPSDALLVDVDYDSNAELRKRYGVTMQTTFVLVDEKGEELEQFTASGIDDLKKRLGA